MRPARFQVRPELADPELGQRPTAASKSWKPRAGRCMYSWCHHVYCMQPIVTCRPCGNYVLDVQANCGYESVEEPSSGQLMSDATIGA